METLRQDLAYGVRMLFKNPAFTAVAVLSLAIGIGANSAIFSVTNALLLRPLPFKDADRLVVLWNRSPGLNVAQDWLSPGEYLDIKLQNHVFDDLSAAIGASYNLTGAGTPEHLDGARVTSSLFSLMGANAAFGRVFLPKEDQPGQPPTVILSNGLWQRRFGSDPSIVGKTLVLNGANYEVVGVMPASFSLGKEVMPTVNGIKNAEILVPSPFNEAARSVRTHEDYIIYGKLKPGVTVSQAQAEINTLADRMKQQYPANYPPNSGFMISVVPLLQNVVGDIRLALFVLLGAVAFVLLIACANVANLLLSRATVRQKEIAIRTAVGANRSRVLRQLLTESVLLALMGGVMGLVMAEFAVKGLRVFGAENIPRLNEVGVDARVLGFTFLISLLTGVVFGLVPALRASRVNLNEVLKDGGRGSVGSSHHNVRNLLVIAQVALSLVLLIGAGLLIRSYQRMQSASPGFNPHNVLSLRLALPAARYPKPEMVNSFYKQVIERVERLPGIESVGTNYSLPLSALQLAWGPIIIDGYVPKNASDSIIANQRYISPGYFRTMGIPLTQGRYLDERDTRGAPETVIVNEDLAQRFWPNDNPIGKRLELSADGPWRTVVGIVRDQKQFDPRSTDNEPPITVYLPTEQVTVNSTYLVVRSSSDPARMTASITSEIRAVDPELPVYDVSTMEERLYVSLAGRRFSMMLLGVFAALALILAAIGIYGVMSYSVNQRTHEIGIRMALGAEQNQILKLVIRQSMILVSAGIAIGLIGAFFLTRFMSSMLYSVSTTDSNTFAGISLLLAFIALVASYIPARRATKVDPMIALRYE